MAAEEQHLLSPLAADRDDGAGERLLVRGCGLGEPLSSLDDDRRILADGVPKRDPRLAQRVDDIDLDLRGGEEPEFPDQLLGSLGLRRPCLLVAFLEKTDDSNGRVQVVHDPSSEFRQRELSPHRQVSTPMMLVGEKVRQHHDAEHNGGVESRACPCPHAAAEQGLDYLSPVGNDSGRAEESAGEQQDP